MGTDLRGPSDWDVQPGRDTFGDRNTTKLCSEVTQESFAQLYLSFLSSCLHFGDRAALGDIRSSVVGRWFVKRNVRSGQVRHADYVPVGAAGVGNGALDSLGSPLLAKGGLWGELRPHESVCAPAFSLLLLLLLLLCDLTRKLCTGEGCGTCIEVPGSEGASYGVVMPCPALHLQFGLNPMEPVFTLADWLLPVRSRRNQD